MAQWGNTDDAANSVIWAASQVNKTANTVNQTKLFGNTTLSAFIPNATVGQFGVSAGEVTAARAGSGDRAAHAGWVQLVPVVALVVFRQKFLSLCRQLLVTLKMLCTKISL